MRIAEFKTDAICIPPGGKATLEAAAEDGTPPYAFEFFHNGVTVQRSLSPKYAATTEGVYMVMGYDAVGAMSAYSHTISLVMELKAR